ncbi:MAG: VanZ family protein [Chromatiales bacterium]|nr:VanZ family protein [Chromatiales bacterium]
MKTSSEDLGVPRLWGVWMALGVLLLCSVLFLALMPGSEAPSIGLSDKLLHLLTFAVLMAWFAGLVPTARHWQLALLLLTYGILIELLQAFTPDRQAELADVLADAAGILLGWAGARLGLARWPHWLERLWS